MKIGELARQTGMTASSIRFYEASGLIRSGRRLENGYRDYPDATIDTLNIIRCGQQLGFALEEIRSMLPNHKPGESWDKAPLVAGLRAKLTELEALQETLVQRRVQLLALISQFEGEEHGCIRDKAGAMAEDMLKSKKAS